MAIPLHLLISGTCRCPRRPKRPIGDRWPRGQLFNSKQPLQGRRRRYQSLATAAGAYSALGAENDATALVDLYDVSKGDKAVCLAISASVLDSPTQPAFSWMSPFWQKVILQMIFQREGASTGWILLSAGRVARSKSERPGIGGGGRFRVRPVRSDPLFCLSFIR